MVLVGICAGPYGLNLLSPSTIVLLDPAIAMALAMLGVFVGLGFGADRPKLTAPAVLVVLGGITIAALRDAAPFAFVPAMLAIAGMAVLVAFAGWLLVGQADSEREQQVFVVGTLLLLGGSAAYASLSAVFAGLLAGLVWNSAGNLARARIVQHLEYFQHPLFVLMLLAAGASITFSTEALAILVIVTALHVVGKPVREPFPVTSGAAAIAIALDIFRGGLR